MTQNVYDDLFKMSLYSAKISSMLAQENIAVEFSSYANTASYQPMSRTITFPYSTAFMDKDIHELFMFHEVSHALHIPPADMQLVKDSKVDHDLWNVIVDIRDERLIKARYPGSIPMFIRGYEKLLNQGFFGSTSNLKYKDFADRLNVYAKCGIKSASIVPLTAKEQEFYNRCMRVETMQEVIDMTRELLGINTNNTIPRADMLDDIIERLKESGDGTDDDGDPLSEKELLKKAEEALDKIREERVQAAFDANFANSIMHNTKVISFEPIPLGQSQYSPVKLYTEFVKTTYLNDCFGEDLAAGTSAVRTVRKDIRTSVDSMIRIFESKKAAERARNAKIADTGMIDVNKVHRHLFDNKIFRRSVKLPNSKNHAYCILVDFSGSMTRSYDHVIQQLIVVTEFFRRIQVPYKVFAFGFDLDRRIFSSKPTAFYQSSIYTSYYSAERPNFLFELLNSEQTTNEHNIALTGLMHKIGFCLSNTPTLHAISAAENIATEFFARTGASSKHMLVITDGEPTDGGYSNSGKTVIITDPVAHSKVVYRGNSPYGMCNAIGKIIENRRGIKFSTISITSSLTDRIVSSFVTSAIDKSNTEQFRKAGYTNIPDPFTNNPIFFAKPMAVDTGIDEYDISEKRTSTQISRALLANMKHINKSRNFLNALAESLS